MQCPKCRLHNPDNAMQCDCGYDFDARRQGDTTQDAEGKKADNSIMILGWVFSVLGGLVGLIIACHIAYAKTGGNYRYDYLSRRQGRSMLALAIVMMLAGIGVSIMRNFG